MVLALSLALACHLDGKAKAIINIWENLCEFVDSKFVDYFDIFVTLQGKIRKQKEIDHDITGKSEREW